MHCTFLLAQGQSNVVDQQRSLEDRYYNNQTFQEDYSLNRSDLNDAATKIQAQYRGHRTRENLRQMKDDNKHMIDDEEHDDVKEKKESHHGLTRISHDDHDQRESPDEENLIRLDPDVYQDVDPVEQEPLDENIKRNPLLDRFDDWQPNELMQRGEAAENNVDTEHWTDFQQTQFNELMATDRIENFDLDDIVHSDSPPRSNRSTENFEHKTNVIYLPNFHDDEEEMNGDHNRDKAATRIQASFRGYKTRKELGSVSGHSHSTHEHHPSSFSSRHDDDYGTARSKNILSPSAEGNKVPVHEHDDNAAAIKIQAAYRGYRVRKDLEK